MAIIFQMGFKLPFPTSLITGPLPPAPFPFFLFPSPPVHYNNDGRPPPDCDNTLLRGGEEWVRRWVVHPFISLSLRTPSFLRYPLLFLVPSAKNGGEREREGERERAGKMAGFTRLHSLESSTLSSVAPFPFQLPPASHTSPPLQESPEWLHAVGDPADTGAGVAAPAAVATADPATTTPANRLPEACPTQPSAAATAAAAPTALGARDGGGGAEGHGTAPWRLSPSLLEVLATPVVRRRVRGRRGVAVGAAAAAPPAPLFPLREAPSGGSDALVAAQQASVGFGGREVLVPILWATAASWVEATVLAAPARAPPPPPPPAARPTPSDAEVQRAAALAACTDAPWRRRIAGGVRQTAREQGQAAPPTLAFFMSSLAAKAQRALEGEDRWEERRRRARLGGGGGGTDKLRDADCAGVQLRLRPQATLALTVAPAAHTPGALCGGADALARGLLRCGAVAGEETRLLYDAFVAQVVAPLLRPPQQQQQERHSGGSSSSSGGSLDALALYTARSSRMMCLPPPHCTAAGRRVPRCRRQRIGAAQGNWWCNVFRGACVGPVPEALAVSRCRGYARADVASACLQRQRAAAAADEEDARAEFAQLRWALLFCDGTDPAAVRMKAAAARGAFVPAAAGASFVQPPPPGAKRRRLSAADDGWVHAPCKRRRPAGGKEEEEACEDESGFIEAGDRRRRLWAAAATRGGGGEMWCSFCSEELVQPTDIRRIHHAGRRGQKLCYTCKKRFARGTLF